VVQIQIPIQFNWLWCELLLGTNLVPSALVSVHSYLPSHVQIARWRQTRNRLCKLA